MVERSESVASQLPEDEEPEDLGGEASGEVGVEPGQPFFVSKKAAAVLKHGILKRYIKPWASKVGSTAEGKRVVYVDGYAGPGRYADGTDGSPALVLSTARAVDYRNIECHFVERRRADFARLSGLVGAAQADGVSCVAHKGRLEAHLDRLLQLTAASPLFLFLDPFGLAISFEDITGKAMGGVHGGRMRKTEVLLNFSANAVRRIGAFLDPSSTAKNRQATLNSMDRACGGSWWRDLFVRFETNEERVEAIAHEFMRRAAQAAGSGGWVFPVKNRATLQPVYHLVYLSRHPDGMLLFGDALAGAQKEWRRLLVPPPVVDEGALFALPDPFLQEEAMREDQWVREIKGNIERLLDEFGGFRVADRYRDVLGSALGLAGQPLVRRAVKQLHAEGRTSCNGIGGVQDFWITR